MTKDNNVEYSWINFKIDKVSHMQFSMTLKIKRKSIREVMTMLVREYVKQNNDEIMAIISSPIPKEDTDKTKPPLPIQ